MSADVPPLDDRPEDRAAPRPGRPRAFIGLIKAADHLVQGLESDLRHAHGIGLRAFEVLLNLAAFSPDGRMRMSQLAAQAPLSQSRVSRLVAEMEQHGFVRRETAQGDARGVVVVLTDAGLAKYREARDTHFRGLDERLFSRLTESEITDLGRITAAILDQPDA